MTDRARLTELLPCPFCGSKPQVVGMSVPGNNPILNCSGDDCACMGDFTPDQWNRRADLRRESAAPDGAGRAIAGRQRYADAQFLYGLAKQAKSDCAREAHEYAADLVSKNGLVAEPHPAAPDGGLSGEQVEGLRAQFRLEGWHVDDPAWTERMALCNMALRSLERPAGRVVPEDDLRLIAALPLSHEPMMSDLVYRSAADNMRRAADEIERKDAAIMAARRALAASPPAATEGALLSVDGFTDLDEQSRRILYRNLWDLYDGQPPAAPPAKCPSGGAE